MADAQFQPPTPAFSALPLDPDGPPGNAWGRFGPNDSIGMLNLLAPPVVAHAAKEIKTGQRVSLDWPLNKPLYPSYGRPAFQHEVTNRARGNELRVVNDDHISFNTQSSSQWDGFRHFGNLQQKRYFNNTTHEDVVNTSALGIDAWTESGGIVGRGVLVDYAFWAAKNSIELEPFTSTEIPLRNLRKAIDAQNLGFLPGDILFIRSGFTSAFNVLTLEDQKKLSERKSAEFAGIEASEATLRFLWENQFAAVAGDAPSFERSPVTGPHANEKYILHEWLLTGWGMPIGEMFDLEALSRACTETGRYSFFLCSVPLKIPGGVASPPNAVAIF